MNIILGIHPASHHETEIVSFLKDHLNQQPNTFYLYFKLRASDTPHNFEARFPGNESKIIEVKPDSELRFTRTRFLAYSKSFNQILRQLRSNLKNGEKIQSVAFGGAATVCFEGINKDAQRAIRKEFPRRVVSQSTYLPLIYPKRPHLLHPVIRDLADNLHNTLKKRLPRTRRP